MTAPANVRTCYRHPDRVAGISCQRCDRPICPACMQQASVGFHCPECARAGAQQVYQGVASLRIKPLATQALIVINALAYLAMLGTSGLEPFTVGGQLLFQVRGDQGLFADGALLGSFVPEEPWRLLTGGFLHSPAVPFGFLHIGLNMWVLWILGQFLEPALGRARFVALYFLALFGGTLGVCLLDPRAVTVGASGAIYGLMGGALLVARERNIDLMRSGLVATLGINLVLTFGVPGISIGGHLGGLVAGAAGGFVLTEGARRLGKRGDLASAALTGLLALVLAGVAFALMTARFGIT